MEKRLFALSGIPPLPMNIITWCNANQGFLMALLTTVYVVATLFLSTISVFDGDVV
jgi:hypothetical protein